MISRTASKLVRSNGRSGKLFSGSALAASASKNANEFEISKPNGGDEKLKRGKRIPIVQRREMVEVYVKKYRAMNDGKLPCVSNIVKEVGGSYYVVKKLLQEVQSQLKVSSFNQSALGKKATHRDERLSNAEEVSTSEISSNSSIQSETQVLVNNANIDNASGQVIEPDRGSEPSLSAERTFSKQVVSREGYSELIVEKSSQGNQEKISSSTNKKPDMDKTESSASDIKMPTDLQEKCEKKQKEARAKGDPLSFAEESTLSRMDTGRVSDPCIGTMAENNQLEAVSESLRIKDVSEGKTGQHEKTPKYKHSVDEFSQTREAEADKKQTVWGNLKSFADGLMKMWRKS